MYFYDTVHDHNHKEKSAIHTSHLVLSAPKSACFLVVNLYICFKYMFFYKKIEKVPTRKKEKMKNIY